MIDIIGVTNSGLKYGLIITGYTVSILINEGKDEWTWQRCKSLKEGMEVAQEQINELNKLNGPWR